MTDPDPAQARREPTAAEPPPETVRLAGPAEPAAVAPAVGRRAVPSWLPWAAGALVPLVVVVVVLANVVSGDDDTAAPGTTVSPGTAIQQRSATDATAAWRAGLALLDQSRYADYWGTWAAASQASMSRDDYVQRITPCHNPGGAAAFAQQLQLAVDGDTAYLPLGAQRGDPVLHYENGRWRRNVNTAAVRTDPCGAGTD